MDTSGEEFFRGLEGRPGPASEPWTASGSGSRGAIVSVSPWLRPVRVNEKGALYMRYCGGAVLVWLLAIDFAVAGANTNDRIVSAATNSGVAAVSRGPGSPPDLLAADEKTAWDLMYAFYSYLYSSGDQAPPDIFTEETLDDYFVVLTRGVMYASSASKAKKQKVVWDFFRRNRLAFTGGPADAPETFQNRRMTTEFLLHAGWFFLPRRSPDSGETRSYDVVLTMLTGPFRKYIVFHVRSDKMHQNALRLEAMGTEIHGFRLPLEGQKEDYGKLFYRIGIDPKKALIVPR